MHINMEDSSAYSDDKVHGHGPIGSLTADSFHVYNKGERMVFEGKVKMVINPAVK